MLYPASRWLLLNTRTSNVAFTENLDAFLADFGVVATYNTESAKVILDSPDQIISGMVVSTEYMMTCKSTSFVSMKVGDTLTVNGKNFKAGSAQMIDDGAFTKRNLNLI
jgi:hypothetical protein